MVNIWSTQASEVYVWVQAVNADCPLIYTTIRSDAVTVDLKPPTTRLVYNTMLFTSVVTQAATDTFGYVAVGEVFSALTVAILC